jgi:hypothetical protein
MSASDDPRNVVNLHGGDDRARRLSIEVERLARLPTIEWMFYVEGAGYAERFGVDKTTLKRMVEASLKEADKKQRDEKAERRRIEQRQIADKQRTDRQADKRAHVRAREFAALLKLPRAEHPIRLAALAKRLGEDLEAMRAEFDEFIAIEDATVTVTSTEPDMWPEPVSTRELLDEILAQIRRYIVIHDESAAIIYALVVLFAWCHDEIATFSPILVVQGADIGMGKSTLCQILALLTPRARVVVKPTGPALFRLVDHHHPTLFIDNADKLLPRDQDLADIINSSWIRGVTIPRVVKGEVREFDPFCFKVINGVDLLPHLDPATRSRCIVTDLLPKLPDEKVVDYERADDDEQFPILRRKAARWAADNTAAIKSATPSMPAGFNNRLAKNYVLLFAIADLAESWPKKARAAAAKLTREHDAPSPGRQLLTVFFDLFSQHGELLTSKQVEQALADSDDDVWANYKNLGRPINKWEIAQLLRPYKIRPSVIHPRSGKHAPADRGYKAGWFTIAFRHYLGKSLPGGRTTVRPSRPTKLKCRSGKDLPGSRTTVRPSRPAKP